MTKSQLRALIKEEIARFIMENDLDSTTVKIAAPVGYSSELPAIGKRALITVIDSVFNKPAYRKLWLKGQFFNSPPRVGVSFSLTTEPNETYMLILQMGKVTLEDQIIAKFTLQRRGDSQPIAKTKDQYDTRAYGDVGLKPDQFDEATKMLEDFIKSKL